MNCTNRWMETASGVWPAGTAARSQPGFAGACKVRFNRKGTLRVPDGYMNTLQCDPIEKKPFFHALPGTTALSFGMLGCCFHCGYCQNWVTSQALRDIRSTLDLRLRCSAKPRQRDW